MFPYEFYKVVHFAGIFLVLLSFGAMAIQMINGGQTEFPRRKWVMIGHGIGLFLVLLGGFGLLARLHVGFPVWVWIKLAIWLLLGAMIGVMRRRAQWNKWLWIVVWVLAATAGAVATIKPFS